MPGKTLKSGHETIGAGHRESESAGTYSTRASKRKPPEINSTTTPPKSTRGTKAPRALDAESLSPPPAKKAKISPSPEDIDLQSSVPIVTVASPSGSSDTDEPVKYELEVSPSKGTPGRGRGRGRGRGGRSGIAGRATPVREVVPFIPKATRGRGGRVKKSDNVRIQKLYNRKTDLKAQFKQLASLQRNALYILAEKSLELAKEPDYFKSIPEYDEVSKTLAQKHQTALETYGRREKMDEEYRKRQFDQNVDYELRRHNCAIDDILDKYETKIIERSLYVLRQYEMDGDAETTPFYRGVPGETIKTIAKAPPIIDQFFLPNLEVEEMAEKQLGDEAVDSSPAPKSGRKTNLPKKPKKQETAKFKKGILSTGLQPSSLAPMEGPSGAPTPAELSEADDETSDADNEKAKKQEKPAPRRRKEQSGPKDPWGTYLPDKQESGNNFFQTSPHFQFDPIEIGVRKHHTKKYEKKGEDGQKYTYEIDIGYVPFPNPTNFHYPREAGPVDSSKNTMEDLDQAVVKQHKLHPIYGLPIPGSINPDWDECDEPTFPKRSDWSKPLPSPHPIIFLEKDPKNGDVEAHHTSRSSWFIETRKEWDEYESRSEDREMRQKMWSAIENMMEDDAPPPLPTTPVAPPRQQAGIDPRLLKAVNEAPPPVSVTPQRSHGYDPVRDTVYSTPYPPVPPPQPAPPTRHPEGMIPLLADAAELRRTMPPPAALPIPRNTWAPSGPPRLPQPQPMMLMMQVQPQAPQTQFLNYNHTSPRHAGPGLRALRPAPPQSRNPQPPPQQLPSQQLPPQQLPPQPSQSRNPGPQTQQQLPAQQIPSQQIPSQQIPAQQIPPQQIPPQQLPPQQLPPQPSQPRTPGQPPRQQLPPPPPQSRTPVPPPRQQLPPHPSPQLRNLGLQSQHQLPPPAPQSQHLGQQSQHQLPPPAPQSQHLGPQSQHQLPPPPQMLSLGPQSQQQLPPQPPQSLNLGPQSQQLPQPRTPGPPPRRELPPPPPPQHPRGSWRYG